MLQACILDVEQGLEEEQEQPDITESDPEQEQEQDTVVLAAVVGGVSLTANETKWLQFIAHNVVGDLTTYYGNRNTALDRAAVVAWWSLKEGVLNLKNPIAYSNCNYPNPNTHIGAFATCRSGYAWQVGIAGIQVRYHTAAELEAAALGANPGKTTNQLLAEAATWGGVSTASATGSTGVLRQSWLARIPSAAFIEQYPTVNSECIASWLSWCDGRYTSTKAKAQSLIAAIRSYLDNESKSSTSVTSGANDEMFFYRDTGQFAYYATSAAGTLSAPVNSGTYSANWTSIVNIDLEGDGQDEILFYRASDGLFTYYNVTPTGTLGAVIRTGNYSKNWTEIEAVDLDGDGQDELLFYRASDGVAVYYNISATAAVGSPLLNVSYTTGWTSIESLDLDGDGQDELLFYRAGDGLFRYYNIGANAALGSTINSGNYSTGWTSISAVDLDGDGQDEILFYRASDGHFIYYNIGANAALGSQINSGTYSANWSSITNIELSP